MRSTMMPPLSAAMVVQRSPLTVALAPVAAGQLAALYDELSVTSRGRLLQAWRPAELARSAALPWTARLELARLAEHAARLDTAPDRLGREGEAAGCARRVFDAGRVGPLPRLDLDAPSAGAAPARWRPVLDSGCRLELPADGAGLGGARSLHAAVEVSGGRYLLVVDYAGQAKVSIDGGPRAAHGSIDRYGPRASAFAATLTPGRHELELRLAIDGPSGELAWLLLPDTASASVKFVDPRAGRPTRESRHGNHLGTGGGSRWLDRLRSRVGRARRLHLGLRRAADWRGRRWRSKPPRGCVRAPDSPSAWPWPPPWSAPTRPDHRGWPAMTVGAPFAPRWPSTPRSVESFRISPPWSWRRNGPGRPSMLPEPPFAQHRVGGRPTSGSGARWPRVG